MAREITTRMFNVLLAFHNLAGQYLHFKVHTYGSARGGTVARGTVMTAMPLY